MTVSEDRSAGWLPASDAFGRTARLDERAAFPVLGVPLHVRSNARDVIGAAEAAFGVWRTLDPALVEPGPGAHLDVIVHPSMDETLPSSLVLRRHGPVFMAAGGANLFATVIDRRHAVAFITPAAVADRSWLDWHVLAWGRFAVSLSDRVPFHAAAVIDGTTAVLLTGPSGVGKSTLCYGCARAGMRVLAEEVVHVSTARGLRLWGYAPRLSLSGEAARWFPELERVAPCVRPDAKPCLLTPLPADSGSPPLTHQGPIVICRLERDGRGEGEIIAAARPADAREIFGLEPGFDQMPEEFPHAGDALLDYPIHRLILGGDPRHAVALVRDLARRSA